MKLLNTKLDYFDYFALSSIFLISLYFIFTGMTVLLFGGIILILAAWLVYKGEIFVATLTYLIADTMWLINAYQNNDKTGAIFIFIGMAFGLAASYKMQIGTFTKHLKTKLKD